MRHRSSIIACCLSMALGCGGSTAGSDAGADAAARADAGRSDAGRSDAGEDAATLADAGSDAGRPVDDAGTPAGDAGPADAGSDAGTPESDAGRDAGASDAGRDSGRGDAGTGCATNADCGSDYCMLPDGVCTGVGACAPRPGICTGLFAPVCGCDGSTYSNDCVAASNGVNVRHSGACGSSGSCTMPPTSGCCFSDTDCPIGSRCVGEACASGGEGTCVDTAIGPMQCWEDADCSDGRSCSGARRCPCGALCILPDAPGTCGAPTM